MNTAFIFPFWVFLVQKSARRPGLTSGLFPFPLFICWHHIMKSWLERAACVYIKKSLFSFGLLIIASGGSSSSLKRVCLSAPTCSSSHYKDSSEAECADVMSMICFSATNSHMDGAKLRHAHRADGSLWRWPVINLLMTAMKCNTWLSGPNTDDRKEDRLHFCGRNFISRHIFIASLPDFCPIRLKVTGTVWSQTQCVSGIKDQKLKLNHPDIMLLLTQLS